MSQEQGLYYPNGSFRTAQEIRQRLLLSESDHPTPITDLPTGKDFGYWNDQFAARAREAQETENAVREATIQLPDKPVIINWIGDVHSGGKKVYYDRLQEELDQIKQTPYSYVVFMGDLADHFAFNPAQAYDELAQIPDQAEWVWSLFDYLNPGGQMDKLLGALVGNHDDKWAKKTGLSLYQDFSRRTGAYLFRGLSYLDLNVGKTPHKVALSHALQGFSIYNENHPQTRAYTSGAWGADIVVSGHTHSKASKTKSFREYGEGKGHRALFINTGTYKYGDEYADDKGMPEKAQEQMFGNSQFYFPIKS